MTVGDMHIAVNQGVQKIASHQVDTLLPQEIDFELNKAQDKFVKGRYNQYGNKYARGFEQSQKRIDDLRNIIAETSVDTLFKGQISDNIYIDSAPLPEDEHYMFLLNQRSLVIHNNCNSIQPCLEDTYEPRTYIELEFEEYTDVNYLGVNYGANSAWIEDISIACIDDSGSPVISGPFNQSMNPGGCSGSSVYTDSQYWTPGWVVSSQTPNGGVVSTQALLNGGLVLAIYLPVGWSLDPALGVLDVLYPNAQISVTRFECNTYVTLPQIDWVRNSHITFDEGVNYRSCDDIKYTTSSVNRYSQLDDIYTLLKDPFNKTKHTSPITTITGSMVDIYTDETFYVSKVKFTYIKKPREIISTTGSVQQTDLAEHTHQEIVDMAVASILEGIADPRYQSFRAEEMRSE